MDSTKIYVVKELNGRYIQAYSSLELATKASKISCSKSPYDVIFTQDKDRTKEKVVVTEPSGTQYIIEAEWLYHYPEHL